METYFWHSEVDFKILFLAQKITFRHQKLTFLAPESDLLALKLFSGTQSKITITSNISFRTSTQCIILSYLGRCLHQLAFGVVEPVRQHVVPPQAREYKIALDCNFV